MHLGKEGVLKAFFFFFVVLVLLKDDAYSESSVVNYGVMLLYLFVYLISHTM